MLTIHTYKVRVGDTDGALRIARYLLDRSEAPDTFPTVDGTEGGGPDGGRANALWVGSEEALAKLGLEHGSEVHERALASMLQGRHPLEPKRQVRRPGWRKALGPDGGQRVDLLGRPLQEAVVDTPEGAMGVPKSVSSAWALASRPLRVELERSVMTAANTTLHYMMETKPVIQKKGGNELAHGFVGVAVLHVLARQAEGEEVPSPHLHVHGLMLGAVDENGDLRTPDGSPLYKYCAPLETGALFRAVLAEELVKLGFELQWGTGKNGRFFEIVGIPDDLNRRFSARTRDVEAREAVLRAVQGGEVSGPQLAMIAHETAAKKTAASPERTAEVWRDYGAESSFGQGDLERLRFGERAEISKADLLEEARSIILQRMWKRGPTVSFEETRAFALELVPMGFSPVDAFELLERMQCDGELIRLEKGRVTTRAIRERERYVEAVGAERGRMDIALRDAAIERGIARANRSLGKGKELLNEQVRAIRRLCREGAWGTLTGLAGTGKGPVLEGIAHAHRASGWQVIACAVDGANTQQLGHQIKGEALTIEQVLTRVELGRLRLDRSTLIVIEEASKVGLVDWVKLARLVQDPRHRVRILAVGHTGQLGAIELPGMFGVMLGCEAIATETLTKILRHKEPWLAECQTALDGGDADTALRLLFDNDAARLHETHAQAMVELVMQWDQHRKEYKDVRDAILVVHGTNDDINFINALAQERRIKAEELSGEGVEALDCNYRIYTGDVVMLRESSYKPEPSGAERERRVENGTVGIVRAVDSKRELVWVAVQEPGHEARVVRIDQREVRQRLATAAPGERVPVLRLAYAYHPFPIQGVTRKWVGILGAGAAKEPIYVALTRAVERVFIHTSREELGGGNEQECRSVWATRMLNSQSRDASITLDELGVDIAPDRPQAMELPDPPLHTVEHLEATSTELSPERAAETAEGLFVDPLGPYLELFGTLGAVIEKRVNMYSIEMASLSDGALGSEHDQGREAFERLDRAVARHLLREQHADALEARAYELTGLGAVHEREKLLSAAQHERQAADRMARSLARSRVEQASGDERAGESEKWDPERFLESAEGTRFVRAIAAERELTVRQERWISAELVEAINRGADYDYVPATLGPSPDPAAPERDEWEALARELVHERLRRRRGIAPRNRAHSELTHRIDRLRARRGLTPLDHGPALEREAPADIAV